MFHKKVLWALPFPPFEINMIEEFRPLNLKALAHHSQIAIKRDLNIPYPLKKNKLKPMRTFFGK